MSRREPILSPEPWRWPRPRVLVEHGDVERADALAAALRRAGFAVAICSGAGPDEPCPLAVDGGCATAVDADLVVSGMGFETPEAREALAAVRRHVHAGSLLVEAGDEDRGRWPELVGGCAVVSPELPPAELAELVRVALAPEEADGA